MKKYNSDMKKIERIIELTYLSSFLKDKHPLSTMLLAPPEQGKSYWILKKTTEKADLITDLSWKGIINSLKEDKEKNNLKHLVIPDFLKLTKKKKSTKENLLSLLNGYLEEGIFEIKLGNYEKLDFKGKSGGMITATTKSSYEQNKNNWEKMGLVSRFLLVSYEYSDEIIHNIMRKISKEGNNIETEKLESEEKEIEIKKDHIEELIKMSDKKIRKFNNFCTLLETITLDYGRSKTKDKDMRELKTLCKFINTEFNKIEK